MLTGNLLCYLLAYLQISLSLVVSSMMTGTMFAFLQSSDNCPSLHKLLRVVNNSVGTFHKATLTQIYHSYLNTPYLVLAFARNPFYREHCYRSDTVINLSVKSSAK